MMPRDWGFFFLFFCQVPVRLGEAWAKLLLCVWLCAFTANLFIVFRFMTYTIVRRGNRLGENHSPCFSVSCRHCHCCVCVYLINVREEMNNMAVLFPPTRNCEQTVEINLCRWMFSGLRRSEAQYPPKVLTVPLNVSLTLITGSIVSSERCAKYNGFSAWGFPPTRLIVQLQLYCTWKALQCTSLKSEM